MLCCAFLGCGWSGHEILKQASKQANVPRTAPSSPMSQPLSCPSQSLQYSNLAYSPLPACSSPSRLRLDGFRSGIKSYIIRCFHLTTTITRAREYYSKCPFQHHAAGCRNRAAMPPGPKTNTVHLDEYDRFASPPQPRTSEQRTPADGRSSREDEKYRGVEAHSAHVNLNLNLEGRHVSSHLSSTANLFFRSPSN